MVEVLLAITSGLGAVVGGIVTTISTMISNDTVVGFVGLGIAFGIAKFGIGLLPFIGRR